MNDDDLRARLQRVDPVPPDNALDPSPSPRARQLLERAMTDLHTPVTTPAARPPRSRLPLLAGAAAAVAALAVGGAVLLGGGSSHPATKPHAKTTLALKLPAPAAPGRPGRPGGIASCIRFDVSILKDMETAFAGTATTVGADSVTLTVDHWYKGGTADVVTLASASGGPTSVNELGVSFDQGKRYLVTATNGTVNGCGYTGEATPDLEASFNQAFGG